MSIQDSIDANLSKRLAQALNRAIEPRKDKATPARSRKAGAERTPDNVIPLRAKQADTEPPEVVTQERWPLPGLAPMTRVRTIFGDVHAIALRKGDEVLTRSGDYLPILWINRIKLDEAFLSVRPDSHPIVIGPGALGSNGEVMVSPRQVIMADDTSGLGEEREAAMLTSHAGVRRLRETGLTYTLFHVGEEASIYCEGLYLKFPLEA